MKREIEFIIKSNEALAENKIKNEIEQLLSNGKDGNNIHQQGKQQANEPQIFVLSLSQILDLRS